MDNEEFYTKASEYWSAIPATVDGMLGGLSKLSPADISFSKDFLSSFIYNGTSPLSTNAALDVGAGIGRVTKHLLSGYFTRVDMVEPDLHFTEKAPAYIGADTWKKIGRVFTVGLQDFRPEASDSGDRALYDCIWCQWALSHLRDDDLVAALKRLRQVLNRTGHGIIFVKENMAKQEDEFDEADSSVTRTRESFLKIFSRAGLTVIKEAKQPKFPTELYEVRLFALS
ncbi:N-terminal Xaa-Pro-Lys N-methyltransferase 1-B-like [Paramacrobiotus metropolitanus]|uniref:N-terminal Xaa-Pro-Lys N-methyltransferase 1-B-like n=1 Tax=Paramacrobiotus metropolitanus TaxID=2943436 RepID=UPI0024462061|nr:N-terminal Xaa-Pro-Lys N-methyltransferase 1-B-like [Paramacrobiotus metropolitanus]